MSIFSKCSYVLLCFSISIAVQSKALEEVTVYAQKRDQSLQDVPVAISFFSSKQLEIRGITSLDLLNNGTVPSLHIMPMGSTSSTLITTIRGNGPTDTTQVTREGSVAFYQNGFYVGRSQGLSAEMLNLERIEVLRGPQGTLYGRNAVGGAINIISKKPTGEFGGKQLISLGNYDAFRSATHVDLPAFGPIKASIDYVHSERDGWVNNTAPGQPDYNEYDKDGGRINILWQLNDQVSVDYAYDQSEIESTQQYFQLYRGPNAFLNVEPNRETTTRFPVNTLNPSVVDKYSHTATINWALSENIEIKSLSSHSILEEDSNSNWAGALNSFGLIFREDIEQEQLSQEFQIIGTNDRLEWIGGLYYFKENVNQNTILQFSLESDLTPIIPPTTVNPGIGFDIPTSFVDATAESQAIYGQATWAALNDRLYITIGARYTEDEKSGNKFQFVRQSFDLESEQIDTSFIIDYRWEKDLSTYLKRSTGYKAGGVSVRSNFFLPYDKENVETWEIGAKSEWWDQRARINIAAFWSEHDDVQIDVANPDVPAVSETINAGNTIDVNGVELDIALAPINNLVIGLNYTYMDEDTPPQLNTFTGLQQELETPQTPRHAGSLTVDYTFSPWEVGTLSTHVDITSTDRFFYVAYSPELQRFDSYTLFNARITLSEISIGTYDQSLAISLWGRNLTDEEYIAFAFPSAQAFGTPRTAGIDVTFQF